MLSDVQHELTEKTNRIVELDDRIEVLTKDLGQLVGTSEAYLRSLRREHELRDRIKELESKTPDVPDEVIKEIEYLIDTVGCEYPIDYKGTPIELWHDQHSDSRVCSRCSLYYCRCKDKVGE